MQSVPTKSAPMSANVRMATLLTPSERTELESYVSLLSTPAQRAPMTVTQMLSANKMLKMSVDMFASVNLVTDH